MTADRPKAAAVHGVCVAIGEAGVLLRGASGAGKSRVAQALLDEGRLRGVFARLVADDRVRIECLSGRVIARAPEAIAGLIEERGAGLLAVAHEPAAVVRCCVDLDPANTRDGRPQRMPSPDAEHETLLGVTVRRFSLDPGLWPQEAAARILRRIERP